LILAKPDKSVANIAANINRCRTRLGRLVGLSCMAPDIVTAIVEGRQPSTLTARTLPGIDLPPTWADQRTLLGITERILTAVRITGPETKGNLGPN
jgi:site-specific DNA recombinase